MSKLPAVASRGRSAFWNFMAQRYARTPISDQAAYDEKIRLTQSHLSASSRVLEIACGTGSTALLHAPLVEHIHATDISREMIQIAKEKAASGGIENVTFEEIGIDDLDIPAESLDMVMAHSILHLLEAPEVALEKTYRWLKPGGVMISSTICMREMLPAFRFFGPVLAATQLFPNVRSFRAEDLIRWIEAAGFVVETSWRPGPKSALFIIAKKP